MKQSFINTVSESISDWWTPLVCSIAGRLALQDRQRKIIPCKADQDNSQSFSCEDVLKKQPKTPLTGMSVASELRSSPTQTKEKELNFNLKTESLDSCLTSGYNDDEFIITIKTHKDMPRLSKVKHLRIDTSFSYYDDCDDSSYSSFSIPPYSIVMESEHSKSPNSLTETFQCAKTYYDSCADDSYMPETADVSCCPSECGGSVPSTPVAHAQRNISSSNNNNTELFPQTPACSPVAGLSCKPVPKSVKCGLYQGMFRMHYSKGVKEAAQASSSKVHVLVDAFMQ